MTDTVERLLDTVKAQASRIAELESKGAALINSSFSTYRARNGKQCSIEGDDGEKCMIVPHDEFFSLEQALFSCETSND